MKLTSPTLLFFTHLTSVFANCDPAVTEIGITSDISKLTIEDYDVATVNRFSSAFRGNKVVLKGYDSKPIVSIVDGKIAISKGEPCGETSSAFSIAASMSQLIMAKFGFISPLTALSTAMLMGLPFTSAAGGMTIDIYTDTDALVHSEVGSMTCPPESLYFEHHATVHGGYTGCVGEKYLLPCGQDAQGASDPSLYTKTPINWNGTECVETGYTYEDRTFWILWGDPLDKHELLTRTGLLPTVYFPLERGPYPSYTHGTDETEELYDDASSAKAKAKDFLEYIGAFTENERDDWYVSLNEGAEQGISFLWAAMALDIARTTCNRDIYVLMEAPAYGYSNGEIANWVNRRASSFYSGEECDCFPNCKEPTVTINNRGFFPPNIPSETGGDGIVYPADSNSPNSPWFESMVFPENPSGTIKVPQLPNSNRRVCDGVYVWPMYFYFNDFQIPLEDRPECAGWAFATTKGFSASVRTGFILYKKSMTSFVTAVANVVSMHDSLSYGSYSEWSWMGQMQIQDMMMSKPLSDPTSWIGAYSTIMKEKWDVVADGFADCPVLTLTNKGKGAYAFFLYKAPYLGLQGSMISSFFLDVLGVSATTYYWGFRGADPSEFYGADVGVFDFTRMQLYRDLNVYIEVARRAKIVCADTSASIGDFISIDDWASKSNIRGRRSLRESMAHLTERQLKVLENNEKIYSDYTAKAEACAEEGYTTSCFYENVGKRHSDFVYDYDHNEDFVAKSVDSGLRGF